jgi:hypothetical protein
MKELDQKRYEFVIKHLEMFGKFDESVQGSVLTPDVVVRLKSEGYQVLNQTHYKIAYLGDIPHKIKFNNYGIVK